MAHPATALVDGAGVMAHAADVLPVVAGVVAAATVYGLGWRELSRRMPQRFGSGRLAAFLAGLATITMAVASPLDAAAEVRLSAHMIQHMLLMMVAPPLLWLGAPVAPLLQGLPRCLRRSVAKVTTSRRVRAATGLVGHPAFGWVAFTLVFWVWHTPRLYELALASHAWHHVEHACFFATAMLFWRPVIEGAPARSRWPSWTLIPYLVLADVQNTVLAATLTFSDRVIYPGYAALTGAGPAALDDQSLAGVIMWVPGSLVFLGAAVWLAVAALNSSLTESHVAR